MLVFFIKKNQFGFLFSKKLAVFFGFFLMSKAGNKKIISFFWNQKGLVFFSFFEKKKPLGFFFFKKTNKKTNPFWFQKTTKVFLFSAWAASNYSHTFIRWEAFQGCQNMVLKWMDTHWLSS